MKRKLFAALALGAGLLLSCSQKSGQNSNPPPAATEAGIPSLSVGCGNTKCIK